jgi:hypothetical protein
MFVGKKGQKKQMSSHSLEKYQHELQTRHNNTRSTNFMFQQLRRLKFNIQKDEQTEKKNYHLKVQSHMI